MWLHIPLIFFLDSNNPCQDLLFPKSDNLSKNIVLAGTTVEKPEFLGPSQDAQ